MSDVKLRYLGHRRLKLGPGGSVIGHRDTIVVEKSVAESLKDSPNWERVRRGAVADAAIRERS